MNNPYKVQNSSTLLDRPLTIDERMLVESGQEILHQLFGDCQCQDPMSHLARLIKETEEGE